ncbi:hypothetical protein GCM10008983_07340 [Lentibacillus halophilus]|uniref:Uncharacterized protein n=1 Tax=Lentibacillus halophilus TaxID=295065 RepID=A0ABP3J089_9BACI
MLRSQRDIDLQKQQGINSITIELELTESIKNANDVPIVILYAKNENGKKVNKNHIPIDLNADEDKN